MLQGNYPVVREDAAQMCALQVQAEYASSLADNEEALLQCIERYITKQVRAFLLCSRHLKLAASRIPAMLGVYISS